MTRSCEAAELDLTIIGAVLGTSVAPCEEPGEVFVHDFLLCRGCAAAIEVAQELLGALQNLEGPGIDL